MTTAEDAKETGRVEAFSDGVFAIAITLLVLELKVPHLDDGGGGRLAAALLRQWPSYLAFVSSFASLWRSVIATVPPGMRVPDGMLAAGVSARVVGELTEGARSWVENNPAVYRALAKRHAAGVRPAG